MKKLSLFIVFFFSISIHALPDCPSNNSVKWNNCLGTYTFPTGDKYVGEFKYGIRHGQGTFTFANGDKYVGEWKNDQLHGQGTYTFANGEKIVGYYKNSKNKGH